VLRGVSGEAPARPARVRAGLSQGMTEVMGFVKGPRPRNRFRISHWPPGSCGAADGLGPHRAQAWPEIPIRIPNQNIQILARPSPFMKQLGVQALARICRDGASKGTARAKALTPNGLDAVASLPCSRDRLSTWDLLTRCETVLYCRTEAAQRAWH
jgi:hypothetical protein